MTLEIHKGHAFRENPALKLITVFEKTKGVRFNRKSSIFRQELNKAWALLEYVDYDVDVACKVMERTAKRYRGTSLRWAHPVFLSELEKYRKEIERKKKETQKEKQNLERINNLEFDWMEANE